MEIVTYLREQKGIDLSQQQADAVNTDAAKVLLLAVPGAGKTTVVTARAARLCLSGAVSGDRLLVVTYNRSAARDMERRWEHLFGNLSTSRPTFSTIHSFCFRLLKKYARQRGSKMPQLLEGDNSGGKSRILSTIYRELTGQFLPEDQLSAISNKIGYCINMQLDPSQLTAQELAALEQFPELFTRYTAWKRANDAMDFDDMLLFTYTALTRSSRLRTQFLERYDHLLVDEAQDTSRLQQEIIALITNNNLFMVGDEDQSIYGFRGAYPKGLLAFFDRYPDAALMKLEKNYRSTPEITTAAQSLIRRNKLRFEKTILPVRASGKKVTLVTDITMERQYGDIARCAMEASATGSCAVLYRTSYSGIAVAAQLLDRGVAFSASDSRLGYATDFVTRDVSNLLRLVQNPGDAQSFRQIYFRLGCGLSREVVQQTLEQPSRDILESIIEQAADNNRNTARMLFVRRVLAKMKKHSPTQQVDDIANELGYLEALEKRGPTGYLLSGYLQRLAVIRSLAERCTDTAQLLERLMDAEKLLDTSGWAPIRLSTVHSAKGQEYDHVLIADALEGIFPASDVVECNSLGMQEQIEEETRLFYTAMTRAKNSLTIYAPQTGFDRELLPSRFLTMAGLSENLSLGGVGEGTDVSHAFFGIGRIVELNAQRRLVTVEFRHYGRKSFGSETLEDKRLFQIIQ
ncbi:MAG: ATP-dependent helicase [Angelakisella sp.]